MEFANIKFDRECVKSMNVIIISMTMNILF